MASRRVRLSTYAYLNGWLGEDQKRSPFPDVRRELVLDAAEDEILAKITFLKVIAESAVVSGLIPLTGAKHMDLTRPTIEEYIGFTLPSLLNKSKINAVKKSLLDPEELRKTAEFLKKANKKP